VSKQIAAGNLLVFAELAPLFSAFLDAYRSQPATPEQLAAALAPALATLESDEASATVAAAFSAYGQALFGSAQRAALILQANTLAVAHEQRRLQPAIAAALNAAITDTLQKAIEKGVVGHLPIAGARHLVDGLTDDVCKVLDCAWDTALTEVIMRLVTASETLDLRRDVPPLSEGLFPPALRDLSGTPAEQVVAQWDKTGGTGTPSGARYSSPPRSSHAGRCPCRSAAPASPLPGTRLLEGRAPRSPLPPRQRRRQQRIPGCTTRPTSGPGARRRTRPSRRPRRPRPRPPRTASGAAAGSGRRQAAAPPGQGRSGRRATPGTRRRSG